MITSALRSSALTGTVSAYVLLALATGPVSIFAADSDKVVVETINKHLRQGWSDNEVVASPRADDGEFARRAVSYTHLTLPTSDLV